MESPIWVSQHFPDKDDHICLSGSEDMFCLQTLNNQPDGSRWYIQLLADGRPQKASGSRDQQGSLHMVRDPGMHLR